MRIFDFDRDGETDLFETAMGLAMMESMSEEEGGEYGDCESEDGEEESALQEG